MAQECVHLTKALLCRKFRNMFCIRTDSSSISPDGTLAAAFALF